MPSLSEVGSIGLFWIFFDSLVAKKGNKNTDAFVAKRLFLHPENNVIMDCHNQEHCRDYTSSVTRSRFSASPISNKRIPSASIHSSQRIIDHVSSLHAEKDENYQGKETFHDLHVCR
jgi:hypothetical protein